MRRLFLGDSGLVISELAMGTQTFGWGADEGTAFAMADRFVEAGGLLFDSSSTYNDGTSESMLGSWAASRKNRHELVLATKVFFATGKAPNDMGLSRKHIMRSAEESLGRLKTDYIDLYQAHCCDLSTPLEETLRAFEDLVGSGKVRYVGASNFTASQLARSAMLEGARGWSPMVSLQAEYSLLVRETEWELLPVCQEEGMTLLAWSPLAGGWLAGKYRRGQAPDRDSRVGRGDRWDDQPEQRESELTWRVTDLLLEIARERDKAPAQVALNYLLRKSDRVVPIFGARTIEQLESNLGSAGWKLSGDEIARLDAASAIPLPYPYRFIDRYSRKREGNALSPD
jgi:aryl-alcohol dehydrogenase-like predicted oxidoreductase